MDIPPRAEMIERIRELPAARPLLERLGDAPEAFLVGGAVRDVLLGGEPFDLDLVVEGDATALAARLDGDLVMHDRFGTFTASFAGFSYDIARARRETYAVPGALPDVTPAPLAEDLLRRDFTVNAIALALGGERAGELIAPPGAAEDLQGGRLRVLHDRSFIDDPTRLLRLARYCGRLGFEIEARTGELAAAAVKGGALRTVSGPRIGSELRLAAGESDPLRVFRCLRRLELDRAIHPGFGLDDEQLARRALELLPDDGHRDGLVLALAARAVTARELAELLDSLAFEAQEREAIIATATRAEQVARALEAAERPSQIAAAVSGARPELVALAGALGPAEKAREWLAQLRHVRLEIDGRDLLAAGIREGPAVGRGLGVALAAKLDGRVRGREQELAAALEASATTG